MSRVQSTIPDIRAFRDEFTTEHCGLLLEKLGSTLDEIYGDGMSDIAMQADPVVMREDLLSVMAEPQLIRLFQSETGKGMILGIFFYRFLVQQSEGEM